MRFANALAWIGLGALATFGCLGQEPPRSFGKSSVACQLDVDGLNESSGVAASASFLGWYYTHNDEGKPMRYWKFRLTGDVQGPYTLPEHVNRDVEDMASASFDGKHYLYFADIGDNAAKFDFVRVLRVVEPTAGRGEQRRVDTYKLHYPDGPKNAESFFVQRDTGAFWIIEKNFKSARVYRCAKPKPGENRLELMGEIKLPGMIVATKLVTGAAVSPDSKFVILRTYSTSYEFPAGGKFEDWHKQKPKEVKIGIEGQGEAICYSTDGELLVTTSEGKPCPVSTRPLQKQP